MTAAAGDELPILTFATRTDFAAWLAEHGSTSRGAQLRIARSASRHTSVSYPEAVEVALCHGWIDGRRDGLDADHYLQRFTPRTARSRWSKVNRTRAEEFIARGEMAPSGLRAVEAAKADGRWDAAYDAPSTATVPDDLRAALDRDPRAAGFFATLNSRNRYAILHRLQAAARPETRARRLASFVAMLAEGRTLHP